jgi:hypothetical protein
MAGTAYTDDLPPWLIAVKFKYSPRLVGWIRPIPGSKWMPETKTWICPVEMVDLLVKEGKRCGVQVEIVHSTRLLTPETF